MSGVDVAGDRWALNHTVHRPGQRRGHYESFYQRANHPSRPLAFWIRYTIYAPDGRPDDAVGELWAVLFDGETRRHVVARTELPLRECSFASDRFDVRVGDATLGPDRLHGAAGELAWDLRYSGEAPPVLLLPERLYGAPLPKAKSLVALPLARYSGLVRAGDRTVDVDGWVGSQNHNWGSEHTARYAFGQVAGFDGAPDAFLEVATVQARVAGPLLTPKLTTLVLRLGDQEYSLVRPRQALRGRADYRPFDWTFETGSADAQVRGRISAPREAFVALRYANPPGGVKFCLNTKIASAELTVSQRGRAARTLRTRNRALFEILTDDPGHGVPLRA